MKKVCKTCGAEKVASRTKFSEFSWRKERNAYHNDCKACRNAKRYAADRTRKARVSSKEKDAIEKTPHGFLAADIIEKAIRDWRKYSDLSVEHRGSTDYGDVRAMIRQQGYGTIREELLAFFASDWFEELAEMADSSPEYIRKHVLEAEG